MNSIHQEGQEVQQDSAQEQNNSNNSAIHQACADSANVECGIITTGYVGNKYLPASELKERISFRELLEADGHQFRGNGQKALCCCPFHPDRNPSFSVFPSDAYVHCFGCGWKGDIFAYEMASRHIEFTEVIESPALVQNE